MKKSCFVLFAALLLSACTKQHLPVANYDIIPQPNIQLEEGKPFELGPKTIILYEEGLQREAQFLSEYVNDIMAITLPVQEYKGQSDGIVLRIEPDCFDHAEAYEINIATNQIFIKGADAAGVFYGIQTLRKSLPIGTNSDKVNLTCGKVSGAPQFAYRGMHLDCSRHFFPVSTVKHYIDMLALHGMNKLHWHLTDDQGWRVEIKKYPRLAEVGGWRSGTTLGHNSPVNDGIRYGGYYTQEEIRDIVRYAAERYITIIPEIDMPGHMLGALAAYPELGCTGGPYDVWGMWGVADDILCLGKDHTLQFVKDVLDEVMQLFPGEYIHIGGDESPRVRWEACPLCQQRIRDLGITSKGKQSAEALLQGWFTTEIQNYLSLHGRRIIGRDELLGCDVESSGTIMSWRGAEPGAEGAKLGHDVIMTPVGPLYFDYYQTSSTWNEPTAFGGCNTLKKVYDFEPVAEDLPADARHHILGAQANVWTEYITCEPQIDYQVLPRMAALAELQWLPADLKDYQDFKARLPRLVEIYKYYGWTYRAKSLVQDDEEKEK